MDYGFLVPLLAALGLIGLHELGDSDEKDTVAPAPEPEPEQVQDGTGSVLDGTAGDDSLVLTDPDGGIVAPGSGSDDIVVNTGQPPAGLHEDREFWYPFYVDIIVPDPVAGSWTDADGTSHAVGVTELSVDGNDAITVESGFVLVNSMGGENRIDLSGADYARITSEEGDTIIGASAGNNVVARLGNDALYLPGDGDDNVRIGRIDGPLDGGVGNDILRSERGHAHHLIGGEGDDVLSGHYNENPESGDDSNHGRRIDSARDTLDGGNGNDFISGADGDIVTTGAGNDEVFGTVTASGQDMIVTDFDSVHDKATFFLNGGNVENPDDHDMARFAERIKIVERDGDTVVMYDGEPAAILKDVTGVSFVLEDGRHLYDLDGQPTDTDGAIHLYCFLEADY